MRSLLIAFLLVSVILTGCSGARIYTFEKDRVDQRTEGNRGYITGTPPAEPVKKDVPKRTLIGIDMEIPLLPGEKGYKPTYEGKVIREKDIKMEPAPRSTKKRAPEERSARPVYKKETVIVEEEITPKKKTKQVIVEEETWIK